MALMLLAREWALRATNPPELLVLTVDHGLRKEAAEEARWIEQQAKQIALPHHTLHWADSPAEASQASARQARYTLLSNFARIHQVGAIVTAHTSDDVAETFVMRLARGSGVDGLAAIAAGTSWDGIPLLRPLLTITRAQLRAELEDRGATWIEDPSNAAERYERVRIRRGLDMLAELGITRAHVVESAGRLRRARDAIDAAAGEFLDAHAHAEISPAGYLRVDAEALRSLPDEVAIHALKVILTAVGGGHRGPRLRKLEALARQVASGTPMTATLGGCLITRDTDSGFMVVCREPGRLNAEAVTVSPGETAIWDRRFRIVGSGLRQSVRIDALGEHNVAALFDAERKIHPAAALACLPAVYRDGELLGVPVPGFPITHQHPDATACTAVFLGVAGKGKSTNHSAS